MLWLVWLRRQTAAVNGIAIAILALSGVDVCCGQDDIALREAFLKRAPTAWQEYRKWAARLQGSYTWKSAYTYTEPFRRGDTESLFEFKQAAGHVLLIEQEVIYDGKPATAGSARVVNPKYGFELRRKLGDAPWTVASYAPGLKFSGVMAPQQRVDKVVAYPVNLAALGARVDYPALEKGFKLLNVTAVVRDGKRLAKVAFAFDPADKLMTWLRGGWILYDPERHWVQHECQVAIERPVGSADNIVKGTITAKFEYEDRRSAFPLLKRVAVHYELPGKKFTNEETFDFRLQEADAPDSAFMLSAYGFPDPVDASQGVRSGPSWYIWFAAIGLCCLGGAYMLRRGLPWRAKRVVAES
jgi:hypothetical protein